MVFPSVWENPRSVAGHFYSRMALIAEGYAESTTTGSAPSRSKGKDGRLNPPPQADYAMIARSRDDSWVLTVHGWGDKPLARLVVGV